MNLIGRYVPEIWRFDFFPNERSVGCPTLFQGAGASYSFTEINIKVGSQISSDYLLEDLSVYNYLKFYYAILSVASKVKIFILQ